MSGKDELMVGYLSEKLGIETHFIDGAFISYKLKEDHIHIHEAFVKKERRGEGLSKELMSFIKDLAKENEYKFITCNCQLNHEGAELSVLRIMQAGFKLFEDPRQLEFYMEVD